MLKAMRTKFNERERTNRMERMQTFRWGRQRLWSVSGLTPEIF